MQDIFQDWIEIDGSGAIDVAQSAARWLDLSGYDSVTFWIEVRLKENAELLLHFDTAPMIDPTLFKSMGYVVMNASATPVVKRFMLWQDPTVPLAGLVRWRVSSLSANDWKVTFRILAKATKTRAIPFDASTLTFSGWWRASYGGSPWSGTASAGSSGSRSLSEATYPPGVGAPLNGFNPADFDGTNDRLGTGLAMSKLVSQGSGSIFALFNADTAATDLVPYNTPPLVADTGSYTVMSFTTAGVVFAIYDVSSYKRIALACGTGAWHLAQLRWNGTTMDARLDAGPWSSAACSGPYSVAYELHSGCNWNASIFFDGRIAEIGVVNGVVSNEQFDAIRGYLNARYSISV